MVGHSHALICTYICIFHSRFLQLENDLREIKTSFFIASFYSEMCFKKTTYIYIVFVNLQIKNEQTNKKNNQKRL